MILKNRGFSLTGLIFHPHEGSDQTPKKSSLETIGNCQNGIFTGKIIITIIIIDEKNYVA